MGEEPTRAAAMKKTRRGKRGKKKKGAPIDGGGKDSTRASVDKTITDLLDNPVNPELDSKWEDERGALKSEIDASKGKLFELDDETKASFAESLAAEQALAERQFGNQRDNLLTRLFGQGRTEGQLAGTMGGQLIGDQQLVLQQMQAANSDQQLQSRFHLGDQNLRALGLQSQNLDSGRAAALQEMGLQQNERQGRLSAATGLKSSYLSSDASRYGADQALKGARASAAAHVKSSEISAAASRANAMAAAGASRYATDAGVFNNMMRLDQGGAQFGQTMDYQYKALDTNAALTREGYANQLKMVEMQQPSTFDKVLGAAGAAAGFFSDIRLKENIRIIPNAVDKVMELDGVLFNWLGSEDAQSGGVIAQQVEQVLPELVEEDDVGHKMVDYNGLIGLLIQAVKELANGN